METRILHFLAVLIASLCVLASCEAEGNLRLSENKAGDFQDVHKQEVERILSLCKEEFRNDVGVAEKIKSFLYQALTDGFFSLFSDGDLTDKGFTDIAINDLSAEESREFWNCLREENYLTTSYSCKEIQSKLVSRCPKLFHKWSFVPRRSLRHKRHNQHKRNKHKRHPNQDLLVKRNTPPPSPAVHKGTIAHAPSRSRSPIPGSHSTKQPLRAKSPLRPPVASPPNYGAPPPKQQNSVAKQEKDSPPPKQQNSAAKQAGDSPPAKQQNSAAKQAGDSPPPKQQNSAAKQAGDSPAPKQQNSASKQAGDSPPPTQQNSAAKQAGNPNQPEQRKSLLVRGTVGVTVAASALVAFLLWWLLRKNKTIGNQKDRNQDNNHLQIYSTEFSSVPAQKSWSTALSSNNVFKTSGAAAANNSLPVAGNRYSSGSQGGTTMAEASGDAPTVLPLPSRKLETSSPQPPPPPPVKHLAPNPPPRPPPNPSPLGPNRNPGSPTGDSDGKKAKMKPFFWDKVQANSDHSMVWNDIKAGSFQFNEELMESLFGYAPTDQGKKKMNPESGPNYIQIVDPKKATNLSILLRALHVTMKECSDALNEGNELPTELVQTLIKMAPSPDEELKLRLFDGDVTQLGPAERFLKHIIEIPFAFKRLESILFMSTIQEELSSTRESFAILEVACEDLKNNRLFLKLLEAVLKTGNRMNDGTYRGGANAFRLDTLLKVSDVKGTDGKTTLLHFVVQEIIRSEGARAARRLKENQSLSSVKSEDLNDGSAHETEEYHCGLGLQVISGVSDELDSVKKAAIIDGDNLHSIVSKMGNSLAKAKKFLQNELQNLEEESLFQKTLTTFVERAEADVGALLDEEKRIMALVKSTGDYFHGSSTRDEGLRLFVIVRDFLIILDKVCKEVEAEVKAEAKAETTMPKKTPRDDKSTALQAQESSAEPGPSLQKKLFPAIHKRRAPNDDDDFSSSDDER